jgi:glycosyltransferase involved in cell wall biosynthesis
MSRPRILSVHHLDDTASWASRTGDIRNYDPQFFGRSVLRRLWTLRRAYRSERYDVTVFSPTLHRGFILAALLMARRYRAMTVLAESYLAFGTPGFRARRRLRAYRFLLRFADLVTAQSTFERSLYEQAFGPDIRCRFVPWYSREPYRAIRRSEWKRRWRGGVVLCPGRYRDVSTFVEAVRGLPCRAVIACGDDDVARLSRISLPDNVEIRVGLELAHYRALFDQAALVVLPFFEDQLLRSLGHVAYFAAAARAVPVLTSRTPHLADYVVADDEVVTFRAGDAEELRAGLRSLLENPRQAWSLARRARRGARTRYTAERHVTTLLGEIDQLWLERGVAE